MSNLQIGAALLIIGLMFLAALWAVALGAVAKDADEREPPGCFGDGLSERFPHVAAERCCDDCSFRVQCFLHGRLHRGP